MNRPTLYYACCRGCARIITLGPESVKCPHCGFENKSLEPDGVLVKDLPAKPS